MKTRPNEGVLQSYERNLIEYREQLNRIQSEMELEFTDIEDAQDNRGEFEDRNLSIASEIRQMLLDLEKSRLQAPSPTQLDVTHRMQQLQFAQASPPTFNGDRLQWPSFKNVFEPMVGKRQDLDSPTKYLYLSRAVMDGSAAHLVTSTPLSDYEIA